MYNMHTYIIRSTIFETILCRRKLLTMALPSNIIKKSSPDPPCVTTTSPSSNETASKASATVNLSHLSKFSEIKENLDEVQALHDIETSIKDLLQQGKFFDQYDFIHMSHVIEHIPKYDLIATMDALNNSLRRQGQLFIRTPNLLGPVPFNSLYCTAGHEYGFVPSNLDQFFQISNFERIEIHNLEIPAKGFSQIIGRMLRNLYIMNEKIKFRAFEGVYPESVQPELIMSGYKK